MMRSIIKNLLREMASTKLQNELISMGPKEAQKSLGINLMDYITIAYDNDIVDYVSDHIPELTDLTRYSNHTYDYNGRGPLQGFVFRYVGKNKNERKNNEIPYAIIPRPKLGYLIDEEKLLTKRMIIEFINEFYDLDVIEIAPMRETNFG